MSKKSYLAMFALFIILLFPTFVSAKHMTLLAVSEIGDQLEGSIADLELNMDSGSGRVFLETYPLSKLDTQISTRFAKNIACDYVDFDCNKFDFYYSINSDSVIIGGPSAGAAITVLTIFSINEMDYDEKVAITGTINSGGLIGYVSGLKEKIEAAKNAGMKKVLIPKGSLIYEDNPVVVESGIKVTKQNITINLAEFGKSIGIEVVEVSDIDDAVFEFTGKRMRKEYPSLVIDSNYSRTMKQLAEILCNRSQALESVINGENKIYKDAALLAILNTSKESFEKSNNAYSKRDYYSAASYCFGANVDYRFLAALEQNLSWESIVQKSQDAIDEADAFELKIKEKKFETTADLQTYMIVKERIDEAGDNLREAIKNQNPTESARQMTYGIERLYSAYSWSSFFGSPGEKMNIDEESLRDSCIQKISEAEERYQYLALMLPFEFKPATGLENAYIEMNNSDYVMCLFKASKSKAEIDIVLSSIGVEDAQIADFAKRKQAVAERVIAEQQEKSFPILGYSYLEYSRSLTEEDPYSALLYSEYATELSNLDLYFSDSSKKSELASIFIFRIKEFLRDNYLYVFFVGLFMGFVFAYLLFLVRLSAVSKKHETAKITRKHEMTKKHESAKKLEIVTKKHK